MVSPVHGDYRRCQAEIPLIVLSRFPGPALNIGKTAVVDALRALLAGADDPYPRFDKDDIHIPKDGTSSTEIYFEYIFRDLSPLKVREFASHDSRPRFGA
jgi:hypothetical protein